MLRAQPRAAHQLGVIGMMVVAEVDHVAEQTILQRPNDLTWLAQHVRQGEIRSGVARIQIGAYLKS